MGIFSAIGSVVGGLIGARSVSNQQKKAHQFEKRRIQTLAKDAKAAGIHPYAALGAGAGYSNPFTSSPAGSFIGDGVAAAGQGIDEEFGKSASKSLASKQGELLDAQIAEARSRTVLNSANAKRTLIGPSAPTDPFAMRKENALIEVRLENGTIVKIPNPDVYEVGPTELVTGRTLLEGGRGVKAAQDTPKSKQKYQAWPTDGAFDYLAP